MLSSALPTVTLGLVLIRQAWSGQLTDTTYYTKAVCSVLHLLSNTHVDILSVYAILVRSSMLSVYIVSVGPHTPSSLPPVSGTCITAFVIGARFEAVQAMTSLPTRPSR